MTEAHGTTQAPLLPVYVLVDVSSSMDGDPIKAANEIVPALIDACRQFRTLADVLRFSLVTFSDTAQTVVAMTAFREATMPTLYASGSTSYSAGFAEIDRLIDADIASLKADGYEVFRPSVFFITDGDPTDDAQARAATWASLTDRGKRRAHPNVVVFGVGNQVSADTLRAYVSHKGAAFVSKNGVDAATSLKSIIEMLVMSVVASANGAAAGSMGGLQLDPSAISEDMDELV